MTVGHPSNPDIAGHRVAFDIDDSFLRDVPHLALLAGRQIAGHVVLEIDLDRRPLTNPFEELIKG